MIPFYKYQGTGNDFILFDQLTTQDFEVQLSQEQIEKLCHRRFGIGADGLMIMRPHRAFNFEMVYYNSDGNLSSMCGNGGRCISKLFFDLHQDQTSCVFEAVDGIHQASLQHNEVALSMSDVPKVNILSDSVAVLNTGSPHYVKYAQKKEALQSIVDFGREIRYSQEYQNEGINVNLAYPVSDDSLHMATYERGVEDETYSCGTGVVAAALSYNSLHNRASPIRVSTKGGELQVSFQELDGEYTNIILQGAAQLVFKGTINAYEI